MKATELIAVAQAEIGVTEYPPNSNNVKYNTDYYGTDVYNGLWGTEFPWCMAFVWWCFKHAGGADLFYDGDKTASCPTLADWARRKGMFVTRDYRPGDVLFFNFNGGSNEDHTGICIGKINGDCISIEGNTSSNGSQDNGGAVLVKQRGTWCIVGAYRPPYDAEEEPEVEEPTQKEEDEDMDVARFTELWLEMRKGLQDNDAADYSKDAREWAVANGIIQGGSNEEFNGMWMDVMTREQMVTILYRFAKLAGIA